jgi:hypothetical protein
VGIKIKMNNPYFDEVKSVLENILMREKLVHKYSWAIPNDEAIQIIKNYSPNGVIEIGAGRGYWAKLLKEENCLVKAYDTKTKRWVKTWDAPFIPTKYGGVSKAAKYPKSTLFLCWPPYSNDMAIKALEYYYNAGGNTAIYVGESEGGCNATDGFFEFLEEKFKKIELVRIPQWSGIHDSLIVWERKIK